MMLLQYDVEALQWRNGTLRTLKLGKNSGQWLKRKKPGENRDIPVRIDHCPES
jgi:hypothetical protein